MERKFITIAVFANDQRGNDKAPTERVIIEFPDGTRLEGGLWEKVSSKGTHYKSGTLSRPQEKEQRAERRAPQPKQQAVDW